ncbi:universal stress protein [Haloplanus ruber]|uniref:Universal stress protein n=1 Tax=Haloplanus ruber TaxID=869892 RepID=A0ABD6CV61_9EURY|nr:universal stress protein [Haloplanus ruber]
MPAHVLVPFDGTAQSEAALRFVSDEWPDADCTLLHVIDPVTVGFQGRFPGGSETWYEQARERAQEQFDAARERTGESFDTRIEVGSPARVVVEVAGADAFDHIALGSHGRDGVSRVLLGSVAEAVVRRAPVPVTVVR